MKKKKLKNLNVKKSTISKLNTNNIIAGLQVRTNYDQCGTGPVTIYCHTRFCSVFQACDTYNSMNRCKTIEVDKDTFPIC